MQRRWTPRRVKRGDLLRHDAWNETQEVLAQLTAARIDNTQTVEECFIRLTSTGSSFYDWEEVLHRADGTWYTTGRTGSAANDDQAQEVNGLTDAVVGGIYYAWRAPSSDKLVFFAGEGSSGSGTGSTSPDRCRCPEEPYEIDVDCGPCGRMPRIYNLVVTSSTASGSTSPSTVDCADVVGVYRLYNERDAYGNYSCVWSGWHIGKCFRAELTVGNESATINIIDSEGHVIATLSVAIEDFVCCGRVDGWSQSEDDHCAVSAYIEPDECTCCADCPPANGAPLCNDTPCCVRLCKISVSVSNLYSPAPVPCVPPEPDCWEYFPPPEEICGGMNGTYNLDWFKPCTWRFFGVPAGIGSTKVTATLTLQHKTWTLRIVGEDGQTAVFRSVGWDCEPGPIVLEFVPSESSCPGVVPPPVAVIVSVV